MRLYSLVLSALVLTGLSLAPSARADYSEFICTAKVRATGAVVATFQGSGGFAAETIQQQTSSTLLFKASVTPLHTPVGGGGNYKLTLTIDDGTAKDLISASFERVRLLQDWNRTALEAVSSVYTLACSYILID